MNQMFSGSTERPVLRIVGGLDFSVASELRTLFETLPPKSQIDLTDVSYVDASVIGEFVRLAKRLTPNRVELVGANPLIRRLMTLLHLNEIITYSEVTHGSHTELVFRSNIA